jgi:hypothetical protein
VTDIILNVKSLVVKNLSDQPKTIRIQKHEAGSVRGVDVQHDETIQIINPEHHIATLTSDVPFVMEMTVENGRGYRTAEDNAGKDREVGVIPVDSSFSPVVRVKYDIEETRVGQKTNYDRLVMEIWTNGTLAPQMAIVEAAKILRKHLNPFVQYTSRAGGAAGRGSDRDRRQCVGRRRPERRPGPQAEHEPRRTRPVGAGHELPRDRRHPDRSRPRDAVAGGVARGAQLRRDDAPRGEVESWKSAGWRWGMRIPPRRS